MWWPSYKVYLHGRLEIILNVGWPSCKHSSGEQMGGAHDTQRILYGVIQLEQDSLFVKAI